MESGISPIPLSETHPILLFDGVCNLCNGFVRFLLKRDGKDLFRFAALQSESARKMLAGFGRSGSELDSYLLVHQGLCLDKSTAALTTLKLLGWPWRMLYFLKLAPRPMRDWVYERIARNRYRLFGRRETCMLPSPDLESRFLP
ncbi:MAG: thiol-disulfide oxidoreductase DCC family protein [Fibrobacteria bacterium]